MAIYNLDNYLEKDGLGFPLNFRRGNPNPLDNSSVWGSITSAQNYAKTDPVAYVGQVLTVVEDVTVGETTVKTATAYVIDNEAGDLKEVGSSPVGDEKTITVSEDGTVSLYGIAGLALTREEEDGSVTKINYQPLLVDGRLTWVEPSATTVEGLATEIEGLKAQISTIETTIGKVVENITIVEMIADAKSEATYDDTVIKASIKTNADAIAILNGDVETAGSVKAEAKAAADIAVAAVVDSAPEAMNTLKEVADWISASDSASSAADLVTRVTALEAIDHEQLAADAVAAVVAGADSDFDTLKEVADWIASDKEGSAALQTTVSGHTESINTINSDIDALETKVDNDIANLTTHMSEAATALAEVDGRLDALEAFEETHASIEISSIEGLFNTQA